MGGKGGDPKMKVTTYFMSLHVGVCTGPVDAVKAIIVGDKVAWEGNRTTPGVETIAKPELYGGLKKEGGLAGDVAFLLGDQTQVMPEVIASLFGESPGTMPAYRGITSLFFRGSIDWDGSFVDVSSYLYVPPNGIAVETGNQVVGFTVELSTEDLTGFIVDLDYDIAAAGYDPDRVPQCSVSVNDANPPPEDTATMPNDSAIMLLRNLAGVMDTTILEFVSLNNLSQVKGTTGTTDQSTDQGATLVRFFCVFDGATGVLTIHREGGSSVSQTLSPGSFSLSRFESASDLGTARAIIKSDVSDPVFPAGTVPLADVL